MMINLAVASYYSINKIFAIKRDYLNTKDKPVVNSH